MEEFKPIFQVGDWIKNIHMLDSTEEYFVLAANIVDREYSLSKHSKLLKGTHEYGVEMVSFDAQYCFIKVG